MKSFTKFFLTFALLMSAVFTYAQSYQYMTPEEVAHFKAIEQQKTAALGPVTTAQSGDRSVTNDCATAMSYGNINDPAVTGSISSYGEEWYSFTGSDNMTVTVSLCNSDFDTKLEVWNDCGDANYAYYNDDNCGLQSEIAGIPFTAGDVMYVKVYGYGSSSGNYELSITGTLPPPSATPIATFPFTIDFENGDFPDEIQAVAGGDANISVSPDAANSSSFGAMLEGTTYSGWGYPYSTGEDAFANSPTHVSSMNMSIQPNGSGLLFMHFDMRQNYSYNANYAWFRVTVNGTPIPDVDGNIYFQPSSPMSDPFVSYDYDLSAYQGADFDIAIEAVNKYAYMYYQGGDAAMVDNINFEFIAVGTIEGHVMADGAPVQGAHVGIVDYNEILTDANGYYSFPNILSGDYDMYAYKDGMNQVSTSVTLGAGQTLEQDFNLSSPIMIISPLSFTNTLNPEEYFVDNQGIQNAGNGSLSWSATIEYPTNNATAVRVATLPNAPNMNATYPAAEGGVLSATPGTPSGARADCPEGTIWGNPAVNYDNAYTSDDGAGYQCYQSYSTSEDIGSLTFYFVAIPSVPTPADFNIEFYQTGSTPGAQVAAYTVSVDGVNTGEMLLGSYPIYSFTVDLPDAITEHDGWVSVHAPASSNTFYWVNTTTGSGVAMQNSGVISGYQLDVCLGGVAAGGDWLSLSKYEGTVPANGGSETIDVNFDASGTQAGEVYQANIVYVANPNVSQTVVPATMIIAGDPLLPATDLQATLVNDVTGQVELSWTYPPTMDPTFQYFLIRRDGTPIANTTDTHYTDMLPDFGTYSYTVAAVYAEGETTPAGPVEVDWLIPALCNNPASVYNEQWPDTQENVTLTLQNCGDGTLAFSFPDYINTSRFSCSMQVALYDSFGDGWNGGALDVLVNGVVVLDHITLSNGSGPEYHSFDVEDGDNISAVYYPGSWSSENSYDFLDSDGNVVYHSGNTSTPEGIVFGSCPVPSYIVAVNPVQGQIPSGDSIQVTLTYSSAGFPVGDFDEYLHITTNDPDRTNDSILNTMHVYTPATLYGTVTDCNTGQGMGGVDVTAVGTTTFMTSTDESGNYQMNVDEDTYDVTFAKVGFESITVSGVFAPQGAMTEVNGSLCETPYPVSGVYADPNQDDTECLITWNIPMGPYEISYDDGTANDFVTWSAPGNATAVKFTPAGYPATVTGGRMFVGDGTFPDGANFLGSQFAIGVLDDDGPNGMPGTVLDSIVVDVNNYNWVQFEGMNATIADGDFYLVMWQLTFAPNAAPIGVDNDLPTAYRSYVKYGANDWMVSPYQDLMLRAIVSGPNAGVMANNSSAGRMIHPPKIGSFTGFMATSLPKGVPGVEKEGTFTPIPTQSNVRDLTNYTVAIVNGFDPDAGQTPDDGTITPIANTSNTSYNHTGWGGEPQGWYAYAVRANYESNQSDFVYSNIVGHLMDAAVTINIQTCDGAEPSDAEVRLVGHNYPYNSYFGITDASGTVVFDSVIKGNYDIYAEKVGFQDYEHLNVNIMGDYTENIMMQKKAYPVRNLTVDPLTSNATWDPPFIMQLETEDFEGTTFPPEGWQSFSNGVGWFRSDDGGSSAFPVPPGDGFYAISNDDAAGSNNDGSMDYLITPELDLRESDNFSLYFDNYFDGGYSQSGYVEYSLDDGATWEGPLYTATPVTDWTPVEVDLSSLSGMGGARAVRLAFHADDNGEWASGWAVDNVTVHNGAPQVEAYDVFLDDAFVVEVPGDQLNYAFENLTYGTTYTAAVQAKYGTFCELSPKVYYTWTSSFLYPPRNTGDAYIYGTNEVPVTWNPPMTDDGIPMAAAESTVVYEGPQAMVANADQASTVTRIEYAQQNSSRDTWDLQFAWPTFYNDGEAGVECDGNFIYTSQWNGSRFSKYTLDGTWVEDFTIPGVSGVRDLAYDGTYFYGAAASTAVYQMDFENHVLVSTINAPTAVRAIAYNDDSQTFYGDNWSTDITEFDMTGAFVSSFPAGGYTGIYGMAYDNWSEGGPFLWIYDQGANNIIQVALPSGTFTGVTVDVASIVGTTSSAGGLFTQPGIVEGTVTIGGNAQNEMVWGLELAPYSPGGGGNAGVVPDGLLSFNVYRDGNVIGTKPYNGEAVDDTILYVDNNLMPGTYMYEVSAVYDLTQFGFPGETGESALDGVDTVTVIWGMDLPFTEDWATGNFDFNNWTTDAPNWKINSQVGDEQPSAEFSWDPLLENDYSASLTSAPLKADMLTEGDIWLDYNVKLEDRNSTGEEHLKVEVYDGDSWTQVADVANNGSFGFADGFNHINITDYAMGKVFQVRFTATGQNSFDIVSWFVDNVTVYRSCAAPSDLTGEYKWYNNPDNENDWGALIGWEAPYIPQPISAWLHWDDGTNFSAIGLTDGGDFSVAARWDAGQLSDYDGTYITKLQYFPAATDFSNIIVRIWTGANASNLIYENDVTASAVAGMWNEVDLATPIALDVNDELWIGYTILGQVANTFPAGTDAGPAIAGYGDKITTDGVTWDNLSDFGLSYNWNVQVYVEELSNSVAPVAPIVDNTVYSTANATLSQGAVVENGAQARTATEREFTGFKLYRSETGDEGSYVEYATIPYTDGVTSYSYYDQYPNVQAGGEYWYKVSAMWEGENDVCESAFALDYNNPMHDFVYVFVTSVDNPLAGVTNVYPNPARDNVTVTTTEGMNKLTVINYVGQVVYQKALNGESSVNLNTGNYDAGVYVIRIETASGTTNKRVVITK